MNKQQFIDRLTEDKWFEQPQDLVDYRLPVVQFFLSNYTNTALMVNGGRLIQSNKVNIQYNQNTDFVLVNMAYESILERFRKGEIK
ncbi:MAG: hypothetical protein ACYC5G_05215 [Candidatus Doudnabacteria bacterium]